MSDELFNEAAEIEAEERALVARKKALAEKNGETVDQYGDPVEEAAPWPHRTFEFDGITWECRTPRPTAIAKFSMLSSAKGVAIEKRQQATYDFYSKYLSDKSFDDLMDRWDDPDSEEFEMGEFLKLLIGTDRPTTRS